MTQDSGTAGAPPRSFAALFDLLGLDGRLRVVDVGAAPAEPPPYAALLADDRVDLVAFEPDRRQAQRLRDRYGERACVLEQVVGDGSPGLFRETNMGFTASLLEPDNALAAAFNHLAGLSQFTARRPVATCRLDDLPQAGGADFIKLDAQGGEGAILAGAPRTLAQALVIQTEVLFLPSTATNRCLPISTARCAARVLSSTPSAASAAARLPRLSSTATPPGA